MTDNIKLIVWLIVIGIAAGFLLRYFWPLFLVLALVILWKYYKIKKALRESAEEAQEYYSYVETPREERIPEGNGEIIDAEFTVKSRDKEVMHG